MRSKQANGMCYKYLSSQIHYFCLDEKAKISFQVNPRIFSRSHSR